MSRTSALDICCLEEDGKTGTLSVSASNGLILSCKEDSSYSRSLSLPYMTSKGLATFKLYVKSTPEKAGPVKGEIIISNGKKSVKISVSGKCIHPFK